MVSKSGAALLVLAALMPVPLPALAQAPAGAGGCAGVIEPFRRAVENDAATGNMHRSVYARVKPELERATAACAAGRDAEAVRMITATKGRYGYR